MVVRMRTGKSIRGALSYNEEKVRNGDAELILASHFSRDISEMGFSEKLLRFEKLNELNDKTKTNTLHLSLNFSPDDQLFSPDGELDTEKLQQIAADYMERIGFGNQPFLVYYHSDTGHPHVHIVTSTIRQNGKSIYLHNLAKRMSEPARIAIEEEYGLIKAKGRKEVVSEKNDSISNIVTRVILQYKFTSLEELNAILRQYNIKADRGAANSSMFLHNGLAYCRIDNAGYKIGNSIKASAINSFAILNGLNKKFEQNRLAKIAYQKEVQRKVLSVFQQSSSSALFVHTLKKREIGCSVQYEEDGSISKISFIDHRTKSVFSCDELGLTIDTVLARFNTPSQKLQNVVKHAPGPNYLDDTESSYPHYINLIDTLLSQHSYQPEISPHFLKKKRKKKNP